jgi:hypothetical protein
MTDAFVWIVFERRSAAPSVRILMCTLTVSVGNVDDVEHRLVRMVGIEP